MGAAVIETKKLTTRYRAARGIVDVDLVVRPGEVFGFLGPNGAGKTTLIRTLLDFLRPSSGVARVLGMDCRADSLAIRRRVSYLAGDLALYERLTAGQHLDWLAELDGDVERSTIDELAQRFRLDLSRPIKQLSKGNRQKVGLVQAFMRRADLYILDEPTGGLDPIMQHEFQQVVRGLAREGRTVFLSSHVLDEVQHLTDRVGIIRDGRMVAVEAVDDLRRRAVREIEIRFAEPVSAAAAARIEDIDGVQSLQLDDERRQVHLSYEGSIDPLLKTLAAYDVDDLVTNPVDLDEVFLSFYETGPSEAAGDGEPSTDGTATAIPSSGADRGR